MASRPAVVRGVRGGPRLAIVLALAMLAVGIAAVSAMNVLVGSAFSPSGSTPVGLLALFVPAIALMVAGGLHGASGPGSRVAVLLYLAGCAWLLAEWDNPSSPSAVTFCAGLALYAAGPALVVHAALAYPTGRVGGAAPKTVVFTGYLVTIGLLGLGPALFFSTATQGCGRCPANLLAIADNPPAAQTLTRMGIWLGVAWLLVAGGLLIFRLATSSRASLLGAGPVLASCLLYVFIVGLAYGRSVARGFLGSDVIDTRWWLAQGVTLVLLAGAVVGQLVRLRNRRRALTRLVVDIGAGAEPGHLREAIARRLGDPSLAVAYPIGGGRHVDVDGRPTDPLPSVGASLTELHVRGAHLATLVHRRGLRWPAADVDDLVASVHLALEHQRLNAQGLAQLADLRESGVRIVSVGDDERRRLERDLHDGAQQRLVALTLGLRMLASRTTARAPAIDGAEAELREAIADLREIARGLHPVVLRDAGLAAALRALSESRALRIATVAADRYPDVVESTVYQFVDRVCTDGATTVTVTVDGDRLLVEATTGDRAPQLTGIGDRVATLEGSIASIVRVGGCATTLTLPLGQRPDRTDRDAGPPPPRG